LTQLGGIGGRTAFAKSIQNEYRIQGVQEHTPLTCDVVGDGGEIQIVVKIDSDQFEHQTKLQIQSGKTLMQFTQVNIHERVELLSPAQA